MKLVLLAVFPFPNQLRASFATLLLNAGASVLTVQALLGHKHVDTTLQYARVYVSTVAGDYVRAMRETEWRLVLVEDMTIPPVGPRQRQVYRSVASASACSSKMWAGRAREMHFI